MTTQKRLKTISSDLFELEEIIRSQGNVGFCLKPYIVHVRHVLVLEPVSRDHNPFRSTVKTLWVQIPSAQFLEPGKLLFLYTIVSLTFQATKNRKKMFQEVLEIR